MKLAMDGCLAPCMLKHVLAGLVYGEHRFAHLPPDACPLNRGGGYPSHEDFFSCVLLESVGWSPGTPWRGVSEVWLMCAGIQLGAAVRSCIGGRAAS